MIIIVDYGMGNLFSVKKAFSRLRIKTEISSNPNKIENAEKLILPGVGYFKKAMENLSRYNLIDILNKKVIEEKTPILGICLGMQLFTNYSEEGNVKGLGWIKAKTLKFPESNLKIPHIGWNNISVKKNFLFKGIEEKKQFYFVHSYYVKCENDKNILAKTNYILDFHSAIHEENIVGVQFHPEKSHTQGLLLLKNFVELV